jgi:hypothetical protein
MKKVHYVLAAAGMAPALGLMMPAANAATGPAHTPKDAATGKPVKTVSTSPLVACGSRQITGGYASPLQAFIYHSGLCINTQVAELFRIQTGLTERVRYYSGGGYREASYYRGGTIHRSEGLTSFRSVFDNYATNVCEALVANSNHNNVKYGPVCEHA